MKKLLAILIALSLLLCALPAMAEGTLEAAAEAIQAAATLDEQLAALSEISAEDAAGLEDAQRAAELNVAPRILLEVNVSGEESKFGLIPDDVEKTVADNLGGPASCVGLMTVAPALASEAELHTIFEGLRNLRDKIQSNLKTSLPELSMGMSGDFEIAIAEGATIVRIGSAIFGHR